MNYKQRDKIKRYLRDRIINFIPYKPWRKALRYAIWEMGIAHFLNYLYYEYMYHEKAAKGERLSFENELSVAAIVKNETPYIQEWIEYHLLAGVEKFYIYNNESEDNIEEVLKPYIKEGIVVYKNFPGKAVQCYAYIDAIKRYRNKTRWLAIIDADEFIVPLKHEKITDFLRDFESYSQVLMGWMLYGSSGHKVKQNGLIIEDYKYNVSLDYITNSKVVVNPRAVRGVLNPHWCFVNGLAVDENKQVFEVYPYTNKYFKPISKTAICVNHYYCKSWEEYLNKINKGWADGNAFDRDKSLFDYYDKNEVFDSTMEKYIEPVKAAIKKRRNNNEL
ncbi:MAG: glycosyltransferase family 92 protein [Elusimicrobiota bacterium]|jgi:hypothetical protein|nr:glycosyltransferase family 92 protein [Elusimicrobiota bacterium]